MKFKLQTITLFVAGTAYLFACFAVDWPTFRGNPWRTGYYPEPAGCPSGPPAWKVSLGSAIISSPVAKDGILYIGARDSCVYAIDPGSGAIRWKFKTGGWVDASPLIDGHRCIIGSRDSTIYVLDKESGDVLGRLKAGLQLSSATVASNGIVLAGLGLPKGGVAAYGIEAFMQENSLPQWSIALPQYTYSSPAIHGQAAVVGATDGKLYGIDIGRMDTIWSLQTRGAIYLSTPAIDDTTVYFAPGDDDYGIYAVSLLTGKIRWRNETAVSAAATNALAKSKLIRPVSSASLVQLLHMSPALRKSTILRHRSRGFELPEIPEYARLAKKSSASRRTFIVLDGMKTSSVAVGKENVFVIQKKLGYVMINDSLVEDRQAFHIVALDKATGAVAWDFSEWRYSASQGYCSSPAATQNMVYFGWGEGRIFGLDAKIGTVLWTDSLAGHILSSPAIADGRLYVATMEGNIYAYNLNATLPALDFKQSTYCYPNPARRGFSKIQIYAVRPAMMTMTIYSSSDKPVLRIQRFIDPALDETDNIYGKYTYAWDISKVANGVYFARIKVAYADGGEDKKTVKIAVLK